MKSILGLLFGCHISDINFIFGGKSGYSCDHAGHGNVKIKVDIPYQYKGAFEEVSRDSCGYTYLWK